MGTHVHVCVYVCTSRVMLKHVLCSFECHKQHALHRRLKMAILTVWMHMEKAFVGVLRRDWMWHSPEQQESQSSLEPPPPPPPLLCDRLFPVMLMTLLELYNTTLLGLLNKHAPEKVVPNHPSSPWISQADIKAKKARRHAEWKKWKTSFVSSHWDIQTGKEQCTKSH